jgi:hypothetical protein
MFPWAVNLPTSGQQRGSQWRARQAKVLTADEARRIAVNSAGAAREGRSRLMKLNQTS